MTFFSFRKFETNIKGSHETGTIITYQVKSDQDAFLYLDFPCLKMHGIYIYNVFCAECETKFIFVKMDDKITVVSNHNTNIRALIHVCYVANVIPDVLL